MRRYERVVFGAPAFGVLALALAVGSLPAGARRRPVTAPTPAPTAVPAPTATPLSEAARMERLRGELDVVARKAPGKLGIAITELTGNFRYTVHADHAFGLADLAKLPVALAAYRRADQKRLDLDARVVVTRGDLRRPPSEIASAHPNGGASYAYWELLRATVVYADSTAADLLWRALGGPSEVNRLLRRLHVHDLTLRSTEAERATAARVHRTSAQGGDNAATPAGFADFLAGIARQDYTLLDSTNELLLALDAAQAGATRVSAGLPKAVRFAHLSATSSTVDGVTDATNDAGLLTLPDGRRIAVAAFLGPSQADEAKRDATFARVGRALAAAYVP